MCECLKTLAVKLTKATSCHPILIPTIEKILHLEVTPAIDIPVAHFVTICCVHVKYQLSGSELSCAHFVLQDARLSAIISHLY